MKKEAILYEKGIKPGWVKCTACHHYCQIMPDTSGICGVRVNENEKLYLLTYGKALGVNVDPIEKKPLFHVAPGAGAFSFGTAGCNFHCWFCQNWQMSQVKVDKSPSAKTNKNDGRIYLSEEKLEQIGVDLLPKQIIQAAEQYNCQTIAYTYNEPTVFVEYAYDTAKLTRSPEEVERIKKANKQNYDINAKFLNVFVTNGYESDELWNLMHGYVDAVNIDLKGFSEKFYVDVCGGKLQPVLDNIKKLYNDYNIFLELTTLIIPGENDSEEELEKITEFIKSVSVDIPWHISAFHPDWKMLDKPFTPIETLKKAYEIGTKKGLNYIYIGNVSLPEYESTFCPGCGNILIERTGVVGQNVVDHTHGTGICSHCKTKIPGIWKVDENKYVVRKNTEFNK